MRLRDYCRQKKFVIVRSLPHILLRMEERGEETNGLVDPSEVHESFEFFLNEP